RYITGSIVRIKLKNFLTYDAVEVLPGPNLNMIVGPNGTGKSSIVAALALGLAGRTDVIGRQKSLSEFVKDGTEKAYTEIELKGPRGKNTIVKRLFRKSSNSCEWKIDGVATSEKSVKALVKGLNIHVDNLCSFLPQDRVAEFAGMNPYDLLKETQRAAGDANLTDWHEELIGLGKEEK
ncbi:P-loop containing nucleoside triphosphate hydrolase protein, partial [Blyttiomyces helicus]